MSSSWPARMLPSGGRPLTAMMPSGRAPKNSAMWVSVPPGRTWYRMGVGLGAGGEEPAGTAVGVVASVPGDDARVTTAPVVLAVGSGTRSDVSAAATAPVPGRRYGKEDEPRGQRR